MKINTCTFIFYLKRVYLIEIVNMFGFNMSKVTFLDENWDKIIEVKVKHIPRAKELIYLPEHTKYFKVINVVYNFVGKLDIFIIIKELE